MRRRPNGAGTTYWTTNRHGTLICVHQRRKTIDGKVRAFKGEAVTEEEAVARCLKNMEKAGREPKKPQRTVKAKKPTLVGSSQFEAYVRLWSATKHGVTASQVQVNRTLRVYENHIFKHLGRKPLGKISHSDISKLLQELKDDGAGDGLLTNVYKSLSITLRYALRAGHIRSNPMDRVEAPKSRTVKRQTEMERRVRIVKTLIEQLHEGVEPIYELQKKTPHLELAFHLALHGLRPSEMLGLTWDRVHGLEPERAISGNVEVEVAQRLMRYVKGEAGRGWYIKEATKNGEPERTVPLTMEASHAIFLWKQEQRSYSKPSRIPGLVFAREDGEHYRQCDYLKLWYELLETSERLAGTKVELFTLYYLRKIAITLMRDAGVAEGAIEALMGNTAVVQDKHYYASQKRAQKEGLEAMRTQLGTAPEPPVDPVVEGLFHFMKTGETRTEVAGSRGGDLKLRKGKIHP